MLTASFVYSGYSDYWGGYVETDCDEYSEHLLYACYGRGTSLRDIIDQLVEDSWSGPAIDTLPDDVTEDDVRAALLDTMLNYIGRADYESNAIAECAAEWTTDNNLEHCPECDDDGAGDECPECGLCYNGDDYESPIFVVVLRYEKPDTDTDTNTDTNTNTNTDTD